MPYAGRASITSLELHLLPPSSIPPHALDRIYQKLDSVFPRVKQLVLFIDSVAAQQLFATRYTSDEITTSYLRDFSFIPKAISISLDMSFIERTSPQFPRSVRSAIKAAFDQYTSDGSRVSATRSKFVSNQRKWYEQGTDVADRRLRHYGPMSIDFWHRREQCSDAWHDDESEEEREIFAGDKGL